MGFRAESLEGSTGDISVLWAVILRRGYISVLFFKSFSRFFTGGRQVSLNRLDRGQIRVLQRGGKGFFSGSREDI